MTAWTLAATGSSVPMAAILPLGLAWAGWLAYCLVAVVRAPAVRYLPRWAWALVCLLTVPLGGIAFLVLGRAEAAGGARRA